MREPYGSADRWDIGIYLASDERYTESELPTSFGPRTGTPEEGIDHTFILYPAPSTDTTQPCTGPVQSSKTAKLKLPQSCRLFPAVPQPRAEFVLIPPGDGLGQLRN